MIGSKLDVPFAKYPLHAVSGHSRQLYLLLAKSSGLFVLFDWAVNIDSELSGLKLAACLIIALLNGKYLIALYRCLFLPCHCHTASSLSRAELRSVCLCVSFIALAVFACLFLLRDSAVLTTMSPQNLIGAVILLISVCLAVILPPVQSRR